MSWQWALPILAAVLDFGKFDWEAKTLNFVCSYSQTSPKLLAQAGIREVKYSCNRHILSYGKIFLMNLSSSMVATRPVNQAAPSPRSRRLWWLTMTYTATRKQLPVSSQMGELEMMAWNLTSAWLRLVWGKAVQPTVRRGPARQKQRDC